MLVPNNETQYGRHDVGKWGCGGVLSCGMLESRAHKKGHVGQEAEYTK